MYSPKSFDKEINIRQVSPTEQKQFPEQSPLDSISGNGNETEMFVINQHCATDYIDVHKALNHSLTIKYSILDLENNVYDNLNSFEKTSQSNLYNYYPCCQQYNHSSPKFYYTNIQRIDVKRCQTTDQFDFLLNNHKHLNSLDSYDTSSQTAREQQTHFLNNHNSIQWYPNNIHSNNINSERNGSFSNNLVPTLPISTSSSYGLCSFNGKNEENREHRSLCSESKFRTWTIPDSQQLSSPQLQHSIQQENQTISTDNNHLESNFDDRDNDLVSDFDNEMNNKSSSQIGTKSASNKSFSSLPSFLEPHFPSCDDDTYRYEISPWNIVGNHYNNSSSLTQLPQPIIPLHCWGDQVVALPSSSQSINSLQLTIGNRALQDDVSEISFNAFNHFTSKQTKEFAENQGTSLSHNLPLLTIGSNKNKYDVQQKFDVYQIQSNIDMDDDVSETSEPPVDPNDPRPYARPRRQKLRFPGDMYTPQWVKYSGHAKEGYCSSCKPGKWLQLKNSAYWYHKQIFHGISPVSGKMFVPPVETRKSDADDCTEGLCHQCCQWIPIITKKKNSMLWFRHAYKCHIYIKPKSYLPKKNVKKN